MSIEMEFEGLDELIKTVEELANEADLDKTNKKISPYFYMKMEEWGTSQRPPHHSFGMVNKMLRKQYDNIAIKEYEQLTKKLER